VLPPGHRRSRVAHDDDDSRQTHDENREELDDPLDEEALSDGHPSKERVRADNDPEEPED
jgi:hypothetical protein